MLLEYKITFLCYQIMNFLLSTVFISLGCKFWNDSQGFVPDKTSKEPNNRFCLPQNLKKKWCLGYDTKLHPVVKALVLKLNIVTPSLLSLQASLRPGMVVPIKVLSMVQIHLFENYKY